MDSFEFNKIAGAVLGAALFVLVVSTLSDALFASHPPEEPVYLAGLAAGDADAPDPGGDAKIETVAMLLPAADAAKGETVAKKCAACHTFENGGAKKQGPNLWNIVNRTIGGMDGFGYSADLAAMAEGGKVWDYDALDHFLRKPKDFAKGTKMAFGGISKVGDRADLIAYLRSLSDSPAPLPEITEQADAGASANAAEATQTAAAEPAGEATDATAADAAPAAAEGGEKPAEAATDMAAAPASEPMAEQPAAAEQPAGSDTTTETAPEVSTETATATETTTATESTTAADTATETAPAAATETEAAAAAPESPAATDSAAGAQADEAKPTEMAATAPAEDASAAAPAGGVLAMIGSQDVADGEKVARKCKACHAFEEDGKNKSGPPLWNIVNKPVATAEDFRYSQAMTDFAEGGKTWTFEELDAYLLAPKKHVPKTKMAFAGLKKDEDRAAILAYLRSLSNEPAPLP